MKKFLANTCAAILTGGIYALFKLVFKVDAPDTFSGRLITGGSIAFVGGICSGFFEHIFKVSPDK